jgi:hypothetical protein
MGIAVLEQRKPFEDRRGRNAVESRKHPPVTQDTDIVECASIAVSKLRTVDSVISIDVILEICFTVGGERGREKPRRPPCVCEISYHLPSKRDEGGTF